MVTSLTSILLGALALLLLYASYGDLKARTIPNSLNIAIALLAIPFWWASGLAPWPDMALQVGVAVLAFVFFAGAFALGAMGGGDVKLIGAIALWLPWPALLLMLVIMSLAGGALTLALMIRKKLARTEGPLEIPYGVAIAAGAILTLAVQLSVSG